MPIRIKETHITAKLVEEGRKDASEQPLPQEEWSTEPSNGLEYYLKKLHWQLRKTRDER